MDEWSVRELGPGDHLAATGLLTHLNPDCPTPVLLQRFREIIDQHPHYHAIGGFAGDRLVAFAGAWVATKIWCGRYLEIDNFVVHPDQRSSGFGTRLMEYLEELARQKDCNLLVLDSYTSNHASHRLYHRLGYEIWGFHFVKPIASLNR